MPEGTVYIIQCGNFYKIGRSDRPAQRLRNLQAATPEPLTMIEMFITSDAAGLERALHQQFAKVRRHGEWFRLAPSDLDRLKSFVATWRPPEKKMPEKRLSVARRRREETYDPAQDPQYPWTLRYAIGWYSEDWDDNLPRSRRHLLRQAKHLLYELSFYTFDVDRAAATGYVPPPTGEIVNPDWSRIGKHVGAQNPHRRRELLTFLVSCGALLVRRGEADGPDTYWFPEPGHQYPLF